MRLGSAADTQKRRSAPPFVNDWRSVERPPSRGNSEKLRAALLALTICPISCCLSDQLAAAVIREGRDDGEGDSDFQQLEGEIQADWADDMI